MHEGKMVKNAGWLLVLQGVNILLPFVTVPYVTRALGAESYGIFSIALNYATYFQLVIEYGFDLSAAKKAVEVNTRGRLCRLATHVVTARLLLLALCLSITIILALANVVKGELLLCLLVLFTMLLGYAVQLNWLFMGLQDMKVITISTAIARSASVVLIFMMVSDSSHLVLYSLLYSVTFVLSGILTHLFAWRRHGIHISAPSLKGVVEEMRDGMPIFLSSATAKIISNVGVTVLSACRSASIVGSYAAVLKIPQMISMMFTPISQALYPRVNEVRMSSPRAAAKLVVRIAAPVAGAFAIGLAIMAAARGPIVSLVFGTEYLECSDALIPLAVWVLLGIVNNFMGIQLLIPFGYQRLYSTLIILDSILSLILNVSLGPEFGAMGVASAVAISEFFLSVALAIALLHVWHEKHKKNEGVSK